MHQPHPWREVRALTHVVVHFVELRPGLWGATDGHERIWIDHRLGQVERRCTLVHELEHLRRGHHSCQDERTERAVRAAAARRLLPDPRVIAEALVWARCDIEAAADELWVTEDVLVHRLDRRHLHPLETAYIDARLTAFEAGA